MTAFDAIVIGAGPAGSAAALLLARRGLAVAVVEKAGFPRRKVCGEYISATTWPVLRSLGVAAELLERAGPPVTRVGLFADESVLEAGMPAPRERDAWGRAVGREILDAHLLDLARAAGAQVWQPWSAVASSEENGVHAVRIASPGEERVLRAPLVVAAHGSWEHGELPTQARRRAPRASDFLGFKAHFLASRLPAGLMPLVLFPGGYGGLVASDGERTSFSCCIRRDALGDCRARHPRMAAGEAVVAHAMESCRGVRDALSGARIEGAWLAAGPIRPGIRVGARGGCFTVGNAAGEAHPLVAEGISMAIQSAWLLSESLAAHGFASGAAREAAARAYAAAWRRNFAARVRAAAAFAALTTSPATRGASIALLRRVPPALRWGAWWSGKARALEPTAP